MHIAPMNGSLLRESLPVSGEVGLTSLPELSNGSLGPSWEISEDENLGKGEYVFDRLGVRVALIFAYTLVFVACFLGNLLVIVVVVVHRRMRTVTNFFLTNLAIADLCVGVFCVYQNLSIYLVGNWAFGDVLCKMYHFVHSLSYTASVAILTVICIERYVAIVHPIWSKQALTIRRLRLVIVIVWLSAAAYCSPRLVMYGTIQIPSVYGGMETICAMRRSLYSSHTYDVVNFFICFLVPMVVMSVMYLIIGVRLWRSGCPAPTRVAQDKLSGFRLRQLNLVNQKSKGSRSFLCCSDDGGRSCTNETTQNNNTRDLEEASTSSRSANCLKENYHLVAVNTVVLARRRVIRLLVTVVLTFAACNLPFHARKLWQYWSTDYHGSSTEAVFLTIATTLVLYLNSGINPIIYAFLSDNFRKSMSDVIMCRVHQRITRQTSVKSTANRTLQSSVAQPDLLMSKQ